MGSANVVGVDAMAAVVVAAAAELVVAVAT